MLQSMGSQRVRHSLATKQQEYDWRVETVGQSDLEVRREGLEMELSHRSDHLIHTAL